MEGEGEREHLRACEGFFIRDHVIIEGLESAITFPV
jgi:hypothetical protein